MKIYLLKKEKGKKYESKAICEKALHFDLKYAEDKPIGCSISDTKNFWVIAIGNCGLDIEESNRRVKPTIVKALHNTEQKYLEGLSFGTSEWYKEFLYIWTAKEAYFKLTGVYFKQFSVLDDNLLMKPIFKHFEEKGLIICLASDEDGEIECIKYAGAVSKPCFDYAADLLSMKAYSKADLIKKLKTKGYPEDDIIECTNKMEEFGYINDEEYAKRFAENAVLNGKGNRYISQKLSLSGIDRSLIPQPEDEYERALAVAESMHGKKPEEIGRRLASLGFAANVVYKVLAKIR